MAICLGVVRVLTALFGDMMRGVVIDDGLVYSVGLGSTWAFWTGAESSVVPFVVYFMGNLVLFLGLKTSSKIGIIFYE